MAFFCPECGQKLKDNYSVVRDISNLDHGKPLNCEGIGQKGLFAHEQSKKQQQVQARLAGMQAGAQHKDQKSVSNLNMYQTPHNNPAIQRAREEKAKKLGLKGHGSADSNSKQNSGTAKGLKQINK
jgi:hypothetical protein